MYKSFATGLFGFQTKHVVACTYVYFGLRGYSCARLARPPLTTHLLEIHSCCERKKKKEKSTPSGSFIGAANVLKRMTPSSAHSAVNLFSRNTFSVKILGLTIARFPTTGVSRKSWMVMTLRGAGPTHTAQGTYSICAASRKPWCTPKAMDQHYRGIHPSSLIGNVCGRDTC